MVRYPEGSFWEQLFQAHPNVNITIRAGAIYALHIDPDMFVSLDGPEPRDPEAKNLYRWLQNIPDLM